MRVALCVSGKWTGEDYTNFLRERIPHDEFYTATYTGIEMPFEPDFRMDEPENTYHSLFDTQPNPDSESEGRRDILGRDEHKILSEYRKYKKASEHWHKQILLHAWICEQIETDIIIRARFETIVSNQIDWQEWIDKCYDEEIPIGFNTRTEGDANQYHHDLMRATEVGFYINDALIIHPKKVLEWDYVNHLYKEKKLRGAEEGWYQVLSESQGHYHMCYHGGAYSIKDEAIVKDADESIYNYSS